MAKINSEAPLNDALLGTDHRGRIVLFNDAAAILFGYEHKELLGRAVELLVPDGFRSNHEAHRNRYLATPVMRAIHTGLSFAARRQDGSIFRAEISLQPVTSFGPVRVIAIIRAAQPRIADPATSD